MRTLSDHQKGLICALCTALCWGVLAIILKNALQFADAKTIIAFRMIFAFLALLLFTLFRSPPKAKQLFFKPPSWVLILGSLGLAYNYLGFMNGVALSGASNAQVMIQAGPLLLMLSGFVLYKEKTSFPQLIGVALAISGFVLFFKDKINFQENSSLLEANLWVLSAAISWVVYSLAIRHLSRQSKKSGLSSLDLNLSVFLICSLVLSLGIDLNTVADLSFSQWLLLFVLGLNTLLAYGCFGLALQYAPASQVSMIISSNPILTLLIIGVGGSYFSFIPQESVSVIGHLGALLVMLGLILATKRWPSPKRGALMQK